MYTNLNPWTKHNSEFISKASIRKHFIMNSFLSLFFKNKATQRIVCLRWKLLQIAERLLNILCVKKISSAYIIHKLQILRNVLFLLKRHFCNDNIHIKKFIFNHMSQSRSKNFLNLNKKNKSIEGRTIIWIQPHKSF